MYEEELSCRDGFRWSPDGKDIAYWRVDATVIRNHLMINNTDSLYPFIVPVEYPKAGEKPSLVRIGVIHLASKKTSWLQIPGDPQNNYLARMEWAGNTKEIAVVQLNRKQNEASFYLCDAASGAANKIYSDKDEAWVDVIKAFCMGWSFLDLGGRRKIIFMEQRERWLAPYL